jgi:hypothetical protein
LSDVVVDLSDVVVDLSDVVEAFTYVNSGSLSEGIFDLSVTNSVVSDIEDESSNIEGVMSYIDDICVYNKK